MATEGSRIGLPLIWPKSGGRPQSGKREGCRRRDISRETSGAGANQGEHRTRGKEGDGQAAHLNQGEDRAAAYTPRGAAGPGLLPHKGARSSTSHNQVEMRRQRDMNGARAGDQGHLVADGPVEATSGWVEFILLAVAGGCLMLALGWLA